MPAEQMATQAFTAQTELGWVSRYWRKAILFSSPTRDEDATETHLRRVIKQLHSFSLAAWACRNRILHGNTVEAKKESRSALIQAKVSEAYTLYFENKLRVLSRDVTLFSRKTLEDRLKGDDDTLFCWLRAVEVALAVFEKQQAKAEMSAAAFFQPFRDLGKRKLAAQQLMRLVEQQTEAHTVPEISQFTEEYIEPHSQRETEHLSADVSVATQDQYKGGNKRWQVSKVLRTPYWLEFLIVWSQMH
mmetsp:Transcript_1981/g.3052  ORF Transcript_1981/g.3052 Transcript_1981/m.3052 type:complete len:246 (-) Transcript_1981:1708-2445(-)